MNERPRGLYSPSPPSGLPSRTTLNLLSHAAAHAQLATPPLPSKLLQNKATSFNIGKQHQIPKNTQFKKRKSKSLLRFEAETKRNSRKKRRYSDISELRSSRIRLNSTETDRSVSPHNKRRRISDISDLFETDQHSQYKVQGIVTIYDEEKLKRHNLEHFTSRKAKIRVIMKAQNVIVAITKGGLGAAFNRRDLSLLCYLNEHKDEEINSLFENKCDNSLIVISSFSDMNRLRIRSIPLRHIELGKAKGFPIFENETIRYPGWMEYDDVRDRILTYNHVTRFFKLWDLNTYSLIYSFCNVPCDTAQFSIEDVKITNDGLVECSPLKDMNRAPIRKIKIRSLNEDKIITQFQIKVPQTKRKSNEKEEEKETAESQDFLEYHHGYLYVKHEENTFLNVYDCRDRGKAPTILNQFKSPDAYLFLKRCNRLLYFKESVTRDRQVIGHYGVLDLVNGEKIRLTQHIDNANHRESVMFVTKNQTKIIYYSKFKNPDRNYHKEGIIQINSLETGELFGWIMCDETMMEDRTPLNHRWCLAPTVNKKRENIFIDKNPLKQVTAIGYDDVQNEIYVGTRSGNIYIWA
eukprot:244642_1